MTPKDLVSLAQEEERLLAIVESQCGTMEDRQHALDASGVFSAYAGVHDGYASLAERVDCLEALKRALFLQWYAVSEPSCFSGLQRIRETAEARVWELLKTVLSAGRADAEIRWMLATYYALSDYYFDGESSELVVESARQGCTFDELRPTPQEAQLLGRGAMGRYWVSRLPSIQP